MTEQRRAQSAAHRALFIAEIAEFIAACRLEDGRGYGTDLVSLALVCKALYEPAMDAKWREVRNFNELLRCLPDASWSSGKRGEASGPLQVQFISLMLLLIVYRKRYSLEDLEVQTGNDSNIMPAAFAV